MRHLVQCISTIKYWGFCVLHKAWKILLYIMWECFSWCICGSKNVRSDSDNQSYSMAAPMNTNDYSNNKKAKIKHTKEKTKESNNMGKSKNSVQNLKEKQAARKNRDRAENSGTSSIKDIEPVHTGSEQTERKEGNNTFISNDNNLLGNINNSTHLALHETEIKKHKSNKNNNDKSLLKINTETTCNYSKKIPSTNDVSENLVNDFTPSVNTMIPDQNLLRVDNQTFIGNNETNSTVPNTSNVVKDLTLPEPKKSTKINLLQTNVKAYQVPLDATKNNTTNIKLVNEPEKITHKVETTNTSEIEEHKIEYGNKSSQCIEDNALVEHAASTKNEKRNEFFKPHFSPSSSFNSTSDTPLNECKSSVETNKSDVTENAGWNCSTQSSLVQNYTRKNSEILSANKIFDVNIKMSSSEGNIDEIIPHKNCHDTSLHDLETKRRKNDKPSVDISKQTHENEIKNMYDNKNEEPISFLHNIDREDTIKTQTSIREETSQNLMTNTQSIDTESFNTLRSSETLTPQQNVEIKGRNDIEERENKEHPNLICSKATEHISNNISPQPSCSTSGAMDEEPYITVPNIDDETPSSISNDANTVARPKHAAEAQKNNSSCNDLKRSFKRKGSNEYEEMLLNTNKRICEELRQINHEKDEEHYHNETQNKLKNKEVAKTQIEKLKEDKIAPIITYRYGKPVISEDHFKSLPNIDKSRIEDESKQQICKIMKEIYAMIPDIEELKQNDSANMRDVLRIEERLTRYILKLDAIKTQGMSNVRQNRKNAVYETKQIIASLPHNVT